ncbi:Adenine deaminase [Tritrichomonas foetus]|uniref:adenine deaminase n=1 Tax=Tritrichomonas foetus TaxID=1144522 RepID=A0A1J4KV73_9EUKA|nr:Adenine deaminase [Tritrichomonas foetus]|eukprot:OHT15217.1 Adenine deaminase [Tritrichomonas foetus]
MQLEVFQNCKLFDPYTDEIHQNVRFSVLHSDTNRYEDGRIIDLFVDNEEEKYSGTVTHTHDLNGRLIIPAFIDSHMHCESTLLLPSRTTILARHGTAVCIADPHEVTNVLGKDGFDLFLEDSENAIVDFRFTIPSCVPATPFETCGGCVDSQVVKEIFEKDEENSRKEQQNCRFFGNTKRVAGLGEVMNVVGTLDSNFDHLQNILKETRAAKGHIDGHAPAVSVSDLNRYIGAGVMTDHECTTAAELGDRLRRGMHVLIREGTAGKNGPALCDALKHFPRQATNRCAFCTDDRRIDDIVEEGHLDNAVRVGIKHGLDPRDAVRMATLNPAEFFNLQMDYGAISPGRIASFCVLKNELSDLEIETVYIKGREVEDPTPKPLTSHKLNVMNVSIEDVKKQLESAKFEGPAIGVIPNQIVTTSQEPNQNSLKMIVVDRYSGKSETGHCLINGIELHQNAAIASTVAHDSHNIVCVGNTNDAIIRAIQAMVKSGGGYAVVHNEKVTVLPLPIAGLMTDQKVEVLLKELKDFRENLLDAGATDKYDVMMTLSFMCLPVIPKLKLTNKGLFDAETFQFVHSQ